MRPEAIDILCDPISKQPLKHITSKEGQYLVTIDNQRCYPIKDDIVVFAGTGEIEGLNLRYQQFYDKIAFFYDLYVKTMAVVIRRRPWRAARGELSAALGRLGHSDRILEVGIGTGLNLEILPRHLEYYGIDISWKMLRRCRRKADWLQRPVDLFMAEAEALPFKAESFDAILTVGGFNFFRDKQTSICEFIRVARPGAKVVIVDETAKHVRTVYRRTPIARGAFKGPMEDPCTPPIDLIPKDMADKRCELLWDGRFYCVSFAKHKQQ